jgi:hypothetical protein
MNKSRVFVTNRYIDDLLWKYCRIKTLAKPSKRMHRSLHNWMIANRPLVEGEDDFIHHVKDHVSTVQKSLYPSQGQGRMDDFIEKYIARYPGSLIHVRLHNPYMLSSWW